MKIGNKIVNLGYYDTEETVIFIYNDDFCVIEDSSGSRTLIHKNHPNYKLSLESHITDTLQEIVNE